MTHAELVNRSVAWLRGTRRCDPVYAGNASCSEIPDAIGWTGGWKYCGSIVVECKTSLADFMNEARKYSAYRHPETGFEYCGRRFSRTQAKAEGYLPFDLPRMGSFRYFICEPDILTPEHVAAAHPDHGLLYVRGRIHVVREAERRTNVNYPNEIRYLRLAIINAKREALTASEDKEERL